MLFGLTNALSSFQNFINVVLGNDILNIFVTAYEDNILVFSKTFQEHKKHVKTFLGLIQAAGLQLDIDNCKFEVQETKYLELIIQTATLEGYPGCVKMDPTRTHVIKPGKVQSQPRMSKVSRDLPTSTKSLSKTLTD